MDINESHLQVPESKQFIKLEGDDKHLKLRQRAKTLQKACRDFQALFISYMMKSMRNTIPESGLLDDGFGGEMFTEMFDAKIAEKMSQNSSMGIDEMLFRQLAPKALGEDWKKYVDDVQVLKPVHYNPIPQRTISHASAIASAAERFNLSPQLIKAVIDAESGGNAYAVSHKGAKGLMQLMDSTAAQYNVKDPFNPEQNVIAGSAYLRDLLDRYEGDLELALAAYNAGPEAVEKYGGVPPYEETQKYVARILNSLGLDQKQKYNET